MIPGVLASCIFSVALTGSIDKDSARVALEGCPDRGPDVCNIVGKDANRPVMAICAREGEVVYTGPLYFIVEA